jgi:hypothetical protein
MVSAAASTIVPMFTAFQSGMAEPDVMLAQIPADGRYWTRTSDLRLVEPALSQLS